jgi:2-deoxy-D-gluconate 3-dehydrogenase
MSWGPFGLDGKRAIVTGGARGIGLGISRRKLDAGAAVVVVDVDSEAPARLVDQLPEAHLVVGDVAAASGHDQIVADAAALAGGPIDVLVNCAGIYPPMSFLDITPDFFDRMYHLNLRGLALMTRAVVARLVSESRPGKIVNIASTDAVRPSRRGFGSVYGATKGGVLALTAHLARELGPSGISVNGVSPGMISTPGTQRDRSGEVFNQEEYDRFMGLGWPCSVSVRLRTSPTPWSS